MKKLFLILMIGVWVSCQNSSQKTSQQATQTTEETKAPTEAPSGSFAGLLSSIVKIDTYDKGRILESGQGFFVSEDLLVSRLSLFAEANQASASPFDKTEKLSVSGYVAIDRINDLILLKVDGAKRIPVSLFQGIAEKGIKTIYLTQPQSSTIPLHTGKLLSYENIHGNNLYTITNKILASSFGTPVFTESQQCIGLCYSEIVDYEMQSFVVPSEYISELIKSKSQKVLPLTEINNSDPALSVANSKIKGLLIDTDMGQIKIRLFNETPAYRDNFIKLVREHYYDNLLIHRVIKGFCIQSGAADTRYAGKDDMVGWKGPGYTLPAHIVPGFFHRRGMIGSPRKPDTENSKRRSDGSQFYIVTGRTYTDKELNDIEKENQVHFTEEQRNIYKTKGGAPHIDGTFTVFGEVIQGLDVADRISEVEIGREYRPVKDIRLKQITILE